MDDYFDKFGGAPIIINKNIRDQIRLLRLKWLLLESKMSVSR